MSKSVCYELLGHPVDHELAPAIREIFDWFFYMVQTWYGSIRFRYPAFS